MKFFFVRYTKIAFTWLRLHVFFNFMSGLLFNLYYLTKFSLWVRKHGKAPYNDFPSKWDYNKRFNLYKYIIEKEGLGTIPINYLEFGVAAGTSFKWFLQQNTHFQSRFYGFDTFTGLPEDYGSYKAGTFNNGNEVPVISDNRGKFYQGLFQQTLPGFIKEFDPGKRNLIMLDADLYSATLYVLATLAPFLKKDDIIFFDEFAVPTHEFKALLDFQQAYYINFQCIGAANNYYFTAFKVA